MEEVKLLSSAAVLRALYDEKKDIYDILSEFIKAVIGSRNLAAFSSTDCVGHLQEDFGFSLPEAVIRSCLKNRLVKTNCLSLQNGVYSVTQMLSPGVGFDEDFQASRNEYDEIVGRLHAFCSDNGLLAVDKVDIEKSLEMYLTRPDKNDRYRNDISRFIVTFENEQGFREKLGKIEEGLIIYTGIRYSPDLSTLGSWRGELTVFLDSEHLFNATGLNGNLYKRLFDDFNNLVGEVNRSRKGGRITLKYLEETENDIESFFFAAQKIVEREGVIDPSKTAMINICNGCKYKSDVLTKKADFMTKLSKLKITKETATDYYAKPELNVESNSALEGLCLELKDSSIDKDVISLILKIFTKINFIRNGESHVGIDRVSSIFLTESWLPQKIAFSDHVFDGNGAIPFATNIEFLTEKMWFKLNKGFGGELKKPASFDPVIRAKLAISSQISRSVSSIYKKLSDQFDKGLLDKETVARIHYEINRAPSRPEDVSVESISMSKSILSDSYIEHVISEKSFLEREASEGRKAKEELIKIKRREKLRKLLKYKAAAHIGYVSARIFTYIIIPMLLLLALYHAYGESDTTLSIIFGFFGLISLVISVIRPIKIDAFYRALSRRWYRKSINKALRRS
ncbi:hypothetical protein ABC502_14905 [Alkalimonas sp. NCh-2]|uniref:hypothetical protein n=1 Tax=Alkalimonas sp. NCh-2 TaxID=3144846 RepID=UPI0031F6C166